MVSIANAQVIAGPNVNLGGGPASFDPVSNTIIGDPFLQRQNELAAGVATLFVARFIDNNSKDGIDPIRYLRQIDVGPAGRFLDKPWNLGRRI